MQMPESSQKGPANSGINPESLLTLQSMGFAEHQCVQALKETNSNVEAAIGVLFSKAQL